MSAKHTDWKWGNLIVRDYKNLPWSMTALKPIFHRETSTAGNANTLDVSRYTHMKNVNNTIFHQSHGATYKQIVQLDNEPANDVNLYSIDTGLNENPF